MKVTLRNWDATASVKVEAYDPNGDMKAPLDAQLMMPNAGTEEKELNLQPGRCYLLTMVADATMSDNNRIVNPDSQQNMTVRHREDVAPVDQKTANLEDGKVSDTPGPVNDPSIKHIGEPQPVKGSPVPAPVVVNPLAMDKVGSKPAEHAAAKAEVDRAPPTVKK